ncbi:MAG: tRNA(Ile)(2)-agmatinylcytidine synthase [Saccharolobus sp.]
MKYIVGIDDHDSYKFGCTTHFSILLLSNLIKFHNVKLLDLPYLVRLNPNVPWKTRGNAAIRLFLEFNGTKKELAEIIFYYSTKYVENISLAHNFGRKPGLAIIDEEDFKKNQAKFYDLYIMGVSDIIPMDYARSIAEKYNIEIRGDRGIIGSIASIGVSGDYTYELIAYRKKENWLRKRYIENQSVKEIDTLYFPNVFANYDYIEDKPLIVSHGYDPILFGIRGTSIKILLNALKMITTEEDIDFFAIFKSNQGTDIHLKFTGIHFYQEIKRLIEIDEVFILKGGDVLIRSTNNEHIFVYKETGELNKAAKQLKKGDKLLVYGAVKPSQKFGKIIEAEKFEIIELNDIIYSNPFCPKCGSSTESLGKNKGFRCKKCKYIIKSSGKVKKKITRDISLGVYQTRAYRHLTKPLFLELASNKIDINEELTYLHFLNDSLNSYKISSYL